MAWDRAERRLDPIKRDAYEKLYQFTGEIEVLSANRVLVVQAINRLYPKMEARLKLAEDKGYEQCMASWIRALGGTVINKRHLIDALVMTTQAYVDKNDALLAVQKEMLHDFEQARQAAAIGIEGYVINPVDLNKYISMIKKVTLK